MSVVELDYPITARYPRDGGKLPFFAQLGQSSRAHGGNIVGAITEAQQRRPENSIFLVSSIKPANDPELEMLLTSSLAELDIVPFRIDRVVDDVLKCGTLVLRHVFDEAGEMWRQVDQITGRKLNRVVKIVLPIGETVVLVAAACGQQAISSPPEIPTSAPIARPTETPTPNATVTAEAPKPSPTPEKKAENSIPYYSSCPGELLDQKTRQKVGSMIITFTPPSSKTRNAGAIAFFYTRRNERNQIEEQMYVVYNKSVNGNNIEGGRGFWDVNVTIDPATGQIRGSIGGPPGDYGFQSQCNDSGRPAFSSALGSMTRDVQKVLKELEGFGMDWTLPLP